LFEPREISSGRRERWFNLAGQGMVTPSPKRGFEPTLNQV
jgi:hypothetical protein